MRKDGSRFWANVVITAVRDARGQLRGFAKVTRDLTERRRSEGELAVEARRRLEAENQTRFAEMFIGILGHDLRNPLNAISIGAALIKRKGIADDRVLERILQSSERMSNMVGQLLDLTRTRLAGGIPIERRPAGLRTVVAGAIEELQLVYRDRDIRLETGEEIDGLWDTDRLAQVVSNLVGNALEHGAPDKPVTVRLSAADDIVRLSVHSFGPPIPPEVLPMIFDPYRRTTRAQRAVEGAGPRPLHHAADRPGPRGQTRLPVDGRGWNDADRPVAARRLMEKFRRRRRPWYREGGGRKPEGRAPSDSRCSRSPSTSTS